MSMFIFDKLDLNQILSTFSSINKNVSFYSSLTFIPIGMCLNLLMVYIYVARMRSTTARLILLSTCLAIVDAFSLSFGLAVHLSLSLDYDLREANDFWCKFLNYFSKYFIKVSSWFHVLITIDRTLNICYRDRFKMLKSRRIQLYIVSCMLILLGIAFFADAFYYVDEQSMNSTTTSNVTVNNAYLLDKSKCVITKTFAVLSDTIATLFRTILPFSFMLAASLVVILKMIRSRRQANLSRNQRDIHFCRTLLILNLVFVFAQLPLSLVQLARNIVLFLPNASTDLVDCLNMFDTICFMVVYFYQASQFFIHILTNKHFNSELFSIFTHSKSHLSSVKRSLVNNKSSNKNNSNNNQARH